MGSCTYELAKKFFPTRPWIFFVLGKMENGEQVGPIDGIIHLSPIEARFQMFLIGAQNAQEGIERFELLKTLLPDCQFPICI